MEAHESAAKCVSISTKKTGDEGLQGYMVQTVLRWILFFSVNCRLPCMPTRTKDFKEVSLKMVCRKKMFPFDVDMLFCFCFRGMRDREAYDFLPLPTASQMRSPLWFRAAGGFSCENIRTKWGMFHCYAWWLEVNELGTQLLIGECVQHPWTYPSTVHLYKPSRN